MAVAEEVEARALQVIRKETWRYKKQKLEEPEEPNGHDAAAQVDKLKPR